MTKKPKALAPLAAGNKSLGSQSTGKKRSVSTTASKKSSVPPTGTKRKKGSFCAPGKQNESSTKSKNTIKTHFLPRSKESEHQYEGENVGLASQEAEVATGVTATDQKHTLNQAPDNARKDSEANKNANHASPSSGEDPAADNAKDHRAYPLSGRYRPPPEPENGQRNIIIGVIVAVVAAIVALLLLQLSKAKRSAQHSSTGTTTESTTWISSSAISTTSSSAVTLPTALCDSEACQRVARQLRRGLYPGSPPCDDFYQHVCGAWRGPESVADELFQKFVDDVAEASRAQPNPTTAQTAIQKAALAYQSCEDIVAKNSTSMATVKRILEEAGFFSSAIWDTPVAILNATFFLVVTWRIASPFKIDYMQHTALGFVLSIGPSQSVVAYVKRRLHPDWDSRSKDNFNEMGGTFQASGEPKISYDQWKTTDEKVSTEWNDILTKMPPGKELQSWNESTIHNFVPDMRQQDWDYLLETYFNSTAALRFYVGSSALFSSFARLARLVGPDMAKAFYRWYMVETLGCVVYAPWIIRRHGEYGRALKHQRRFCFAIIEKSAGYALHAPYVKMMFSTRVKDYITNVLHQVRGAYDKLFSESENFRPNVSWLPAYDTNLDNVFELTRVSDEATLDENYAQYEDMTLDPLENWRRLRIGLTKSIYSDVTMDSAAAVINSVRFSTIDYYNMDFYLWPDIAVLPFFDPSLPAVLTMAGLGSILSSAIVETLHAARMWWTPEDIVAWNQSHACMHGAGLPTSASTEPDLLKRTIALAAVVTALENATNSVGPTTLRDVPELSGTQFLFIAWCHLQCGRAFGQQLCNEPVRELPYFFKVFKCGADAKLKKTPTCTAGWFRKENETSRRTLNIV